MFASLVLIPMKLESLFPCRICLDPKYIFFSPESDPYDILEHVANLQLLMIKMSYTEQKTDFTLHVRYF